MKKLNRILSLSAAAALALSLTACSGGPSGTADTRIDFAVLALS